MFQSDEGMSFQSAEPTTANAGIEKPRKWVGPMPVLCPDTNCIAIVVQQRDIV